MKEHDDEGLGLGDEETDDDDYDDDDKKYEILLECVPPWRMLVVIIQDLSHIIQHVRQALTGWMWCLLVVRWCDEDTFINLKSNHSLADKTYICGVEWDWVYLCLCLRTDYGAIGITLLLDNISLWSGVVRSGPPLMSTTCVCTVMCRGGTESEKESRGRVVVGPLHQE